MARVAVDHKMSVTDDAQSRIKTIIGSGCQTRCQLTPYEALAEGRTRGRTAEHEGEGGGVE